MTDGRTDGQTGGRTDGGDCDIIMLSEEKAFSRQLFVHPSVP